ncbi:unnamed protein product [Meloidogyne enterolobii]|uniref:Uncharacterized protein n=1 Tax=Meloidogyne enterolobii TaxID=390850 RepID=A0ACB0XQW4_MELEN
MLSWLQLKQNYSPGSSSSSMWPDSYLEKKNIMYIFIFIFSCFNPFFFFFFCLLILAAFDINKGGILKIL